MRCIVHLELQYACFQLSLYIEYDAPHQLKQLFLFLLKVMDNVDLLDT